MKPYTYNPRRPGELFQCKGESRIACRACGTIVLIGVPAPFLSFPSTLAGIQPRLREHAETSDIGHPTVGTCRGFWESRFPERFGGDPS